MLQRVKEDPQDKIPNNLPHPIIKLKEYKIFSTPKGKILSDWHPIKTHQAWKETEKFNHNEEKHQSIEPYSATPQMIELIEKYFKITT